jgi:hypothetical protein
MEETKFKILATLIRYQKEDDGMLWTCLMLSRHLGISHDAAASGLRWLESKGLIASHLGEYIVTYAGRESYDDSNRNPRKIESQKKWKDELSTGLKIKKSPKSGFIVSSKTVIENPALPNSAHQIHNTKTPEDLMQDAQFQIAVRNRICADIGISQDEFVTFNAEGRIRMCNGNGTPHLGVFDFKDKKKGYFYYICRKCNILRQKIRLKYGPVNK